MIYYKVNVIDTLKEAGYTTYRLRKEKVISECALQSLRDGKILSLASLDRICAALDCRLSDLIEYMPDDQYDRLYKSGYFAEKGIKADRRVT